MNILEKIIIKQKKETDIGVDKVANKEQKWWEKKIPFLLQMTINIALVLFAITMCVLLGREMYHFIHAAFFSTEEPTTYEVLERILIFFLYFEFVAMIIKYFKENYHFPIRYFLYIGITALIRLIVVSHEHALDTLFYTLAVFILIVSYCVYSNFRDRSEIT